VARGSGLSTSPTRRP